MSKLSFFKRVVSPEFNLLLNKFRKQSGPLDYLKVVSSALLPGHFLVPDLVLVMTTKCSLKCAECNNLMPYYENPYDRALKDIISDLDVILSGCDGIVNLSLIGGEPFLYPYLGEVLDYVKKNPKIMFANLTSNGTVMPKKEILDALKCKKVKVLFSDYGVGTQKIDEIKKAFTAAGVEYGYKKDLTWVSAGGTQKRNKPLSKLKEEYYKCFSARYCKTILNGKIYACSRSAHLHDLGYMNEAVDYFDIHAEYDDYAAALKDFYLRDYCMACDYCDHALQKYIKPGVQAEGVLH